jgi:hypothetical protein
MKQSTGIALFVFMAAGALQLRACDRSDCNAHPDQTKCQASGGHGGSYAGGGGGGGGDAAHGVSTGGFGESAGGHAGGGGE